MANALVKLQSLVRSLSLYTDVAKVRQIRDKAAAITDYIKRAGLGLDAQNTGAEVKLRAERRLGELLAETVRPGNPQLSHDETIGRLPDGISRMQSHRWQLIASVPDKEFERYLRDTKEAREELTTAAVLQIAQQPGRLQDLEAGALAKMTPDERKAVLEEEEGEREPARQVGGEGRPERIKRILALVERLRKLTAGLGPESEAPLTQLDVFKAAIEAIDALPV